jgi:DNA invertase Pin-like site-specific DNA recombinase
MTELVRTDSLGVLVYLRSGCSRDPRHSLSSQLQTIHTALKDFQSPRKIEGYYRDTAGSRTGLHRMFADLETRWVQATQVLVASLDRLGRRDAFDIAQKLREQFGVDVITIEGN